MFAAGIGITPFMAMLRSASEQKLTNNFRLVYCVRSQDEAAFANELIKIQKLSSNIKIIFVVGGGPRNLLAGSPSISGSISKELIERVTAGKYGAYSYFLCGPPAFMKIVDSTLKIGRAHV